MQRFVVTPDSALGRTRVAEHGNEWEGDLQTVRPPITEAKLLRSVKTGYERWWFNHCLQERTHAENNPT